MTLKMLNIKDLKNIKYLEDFIKLNKVKIYIIFNQNYFFG